MCYNGNSNLICLTRLGNKEAFEKIYQKYHKPLFYFAMRYLKSKELSEDAIQDIFVKLWEKRATLDKSKSIKEFLFVCLKNHMLNMIRNQKNKQYIAAGLDKHKDHEQNNTSDKVSYSEFSHVINQGLSELPSRQCEVFKLKVFQELSNPEIAQELGISINTTKVHYYYSAQYIKSYIIKHWSRTEIYLPRLK